MCNYMQQINKIAKHVLEVLLLGYFGEPWTYTGMSDQTHQILQDLTKAFTDK